MGIKQLCHNFLSSFSMLYIGTYFHHNSDFRYNDLYLDEAQYQNVLEQMAINSIYDGLSIAQSTEVVAVVTTPVQESSSDRR